MYYKISIVQTSIYSRAAICIHARTRAHLYAHLHARAALKTFYMFINTICKIHNMTDMLFCGVTLTGKFGDKQYLNQWDGYDHRQPRLEGSSSSCLSTVSERKVGNQRRRPELTERYCPQLSSAFLFHRPMTTVCGPGNSTCTSPGNAKCIFLHDRRGFRDFHRPV